MNNEEKILTLLAQIQADMVTKSELETSLAAVRADMATKADIVAVRADMATKSELAQIQTTMRADLAAAEQRILAESAHRTMVIVESDIIPKFNLLAEGQQAIREMLIPRSRVEDLEADVSLLKTAIRQINEDLRLLKKVK